MSKVVTFGEIMLRLAPFGYNRFFQNDQLQATFGGGEANVAVSLANFGIETAYVTKVPDNPIGRAAIAEMRKFGVDVSYMLSGGNRLGIYFLEKGASQRGSLCVYDRAYSSISQAQKSDFNWAEIFKDTEWFHFTGITPALGLNLVDICEDACIEAKKRNIKISCDLNYRSKLWSKEAANKAMTRLCQYVDICIANEEDSKDVFGIVADNTDIMRGSLNYCGYESVARQLMNRFGFEIVAITLRSSINANCNKWMGMIYDGEKSFFSKEYTLDIVDRVGGGDSFGAGVIYSMLNNESMQNTIEFAVAASALKHSIEGDFNRVSVEEVKNLLKNGGGGRVQR